MSKKSLVMTVLGDDQPGLVESLSRTVLQHGGNWVESRMAHLAGQFAGIVRIDVAADLSDQLISALRGLDKQGLQLIIHTEDAPEAVTPGMPGLVRLELVGQDRPGIVSEISRVLAAHNVNVEDLITECSAAPNSGQQLFQATAQLQLPSAASQAALRQDLEKIASDLMVDITIE